jgi:dTDP-4-amino-4,6-dideoxygalactose transaminase
MERREIAFSVPDITDLEINEVVDSLKSGWITTGPKTKLFENNIAT